MEFYRGLIRSPLHIPIPSTFPPMRKLPYRSRSLLQYGSSHVFLCPLQFLMYRFAVSYVPTARPVSPHSRSKKISLSPIDISTVPRCSDGRGIPLSTPLSIRRGAGGEAVPEVRLAWSLQMQVVSHTVALRLQIAVVERVGGNLDRHVLCYFQAVGFQTDPLGGIVGH